MTLNNPIMKKIQLMLMAVFLSCLTVFAQQRSVYQIYNLSSGYDKSFRMAIGGGASVRLGTLKDNGYSKQLRNGFHLSGDLQYFFKETWGLGLNVNKNFFAVTFDNPSSGLFRKNNEIHKIFFIGPSYATVSKRDRFSVITSISFGPLYFVSVAPMSGYTQKEKKTTYGVNAEVSGEYDFDGILAVGLKLSCTLGEVDKITINSSGNVIDESQNLSSLMFTLFISFHTK